MESSQQGQLSDVFNSGIQIPKNSVAHLKETAKWVNFICIIGFVFIGIALISILGMTMFSGALMSEMFPGPMGASMGVGIFLGYAVMLGIGIIPLVYLFKFAKSMKIGLANMDENNIGEAFKNLKSHYKFIGIMYIIVMGFYALGIIFALGAGLFASL